MNIQKLPLTERIQRITRGYVAHPEYIASAIQSMAHIPIADYLHDFQPERARLMKLTEPWGTTDRMTYQEIAAFLRNFQRTPDKVAIVIESAALLAAPLLRCYRERENDYGLPLDKNTAG